MGNLHSIAVGLVIGLCSSITYAGQVSIYTSSERYPSASLVEKDASGRVIKKYDQSSALAAAKNGKDLSLFDPEEVLDVVAPPGSEAAGPNSPINNTAIAPAQPWTSRALPISDEANWDYPSLPGKPDEGVVLVQDVGRSLGGFLRSTVMDEKTERKFNLTASVHTHAALTRAALLRKLGYQIPTPKWYKKLTVKFDDPSYLSAFVTELEDYVTGTQENATKESEKRTWIIARDDNELTVTLQDVILEPFTAGIPYHWGFFPLGTDGTIHDYTENRRDLRALLIPILMTAVPESINLFGTETGSNNPGEVRYLYPYEGVFFNYQAVFRQTSLDDLKWIIRRIAKLSFADWRAIAEAGKWPKDGIENIILSKLILGRNHHIKLLGVKDENGKRFSEIDEEQVSLQFKNVDNFGRITQAKFDGYAQIFTGIGARSAVSQRDVWKLFQFSVVNQGLLSKITDLINGYTSNLQITSNFTDVFQDRAAKIKAHLEKYCEFDPEKGMVCDENMPVLALSSKPIYTSTAGIRLILDTNLTSGSAYGKEAKVMLSHTIGIQVELGAFASISPELKVNFNSDGNINGNNAITPSVSANWYWRRDYTLTSQIKSIDKAMQIDWKAYNVPQKLRDLGNYLKVSEELEVETDELKKQIDQERDPEVLDGLKEKQRLLYTTKLQPIQDKFLNRFQSGDFIQVNDTIGKGVQGRLIVPITQLLGNSMSLGFFVNKQSIGVHRTQVSRDEAYNKPGFQIIRSSVDTDVLETGFDLNFIINIIRISQKKVKSHGHAEIYKIQIDKDADEQLFQFSDAMVPLLSKNSLHGLQQHYAPTVLDQNYVGKISTTSIFNGSRYIEKRQEALTVAVRPAMYLENGKPDLTAAHTNRVERNVYFTRIMTTEQKGYTGLVAGLINHLVKNVIPVGSLLSSSNPAIRELTTVSKRSSVRTEAELNWGTDVLIPDRPYRFTPLTFYEAGWDGTRISKDALFKVFDEIEAKFRRIRANRELPMINRSFFKDTTSISQYRVTLELALKTEASDKIRNWLFSYKNDIDLVKELRNLWGEKWDKYVDDMGWDEWDIESNDWSESIEPLKSFDFMGENRDRGLVDQWNDRGTGKRLGFVPGWMRNLLKQKYEWKNYYKDQKLGLVPEDYTEKQKQWICDWNNRVWDIIGDNLDIDVLPGLIGNTFITVVRVGGIRNGVQDGTKPYTSEKEGAIDGQFDPISPFIEIPYATDLSSFEWMLRGGLLGVIR